MGTHNQDHCNHNNMPSAKSQWVFNKKYPMVDHTEEEKTSLLTSMQCAITGEVVNDENMLSSPDCGLKQSGRSYVAYVTTLEGAEHAVEVASTDDVHTLEGRVKAALGIDDLCAELQLFLNEAPLKQGAGREWLPRWMPPPGSR